MVSRIHRAATVALPAGRDASRHAISSSPRGSGAYRSSDDTYLSHASRRSGPYNSLDLCVDRFAAAALKFRRSTPQALRWGTRIEEPGVMDLIEISDVIEKLEGFV